MPRSLATAPAEGQRVYPLGPVDRAVDALVRHLLRAGCWEPIGVGLTQGVCLLDMGHPGGHLPWRESSGDVVDGAVPLFYQGSSP